MAPQVASRVASPDFFRTMGIPLLSGRTFTEVDHADSTRVGVISRSRARQYWSGSDPIGRRVALGDNTN